MFVHALDVGYRKAHTKTKKLGYREAQTHTRTKNADFMNLLFFAEGSKLNCTIK
jgi:hypothetical protein